MPEIHRYRVSVRADLDFIILTTDPLSANRATDDIDIRSGAIMGWEIIETVELD